MRPSCETTVRVRYAETDQMGVVYYANYLVWMEVGRAALCKSRGFNYRDMERDDGVYLAVAEATCRYRSPARFDDEIVIKTSIGEAGSRMVTFVYEMRAAEDGHVLANGSTRHIFLNRDMQITRLPEKYLPLFGL
jgi:acyl-CoA thioester hydrolase